ncbi:hypothetical protein B484DRAFT_422302 [Ochromonadaceae sp. CCMP2298]|nr:hypothetical protein B484DRAFT_422302 [Ochromonadaceae sp. CCMP2298]
MGNQISLPSRRIFVTICASSLLLLPVAQVRATYADIDLSNAASDSQVSTLQGAHSSGSLGTSVSDAGDVNGDGFPDIIVGAPNADTNGRGRAGAVYLLFGRAGGFMNVDLAGFVSSDSTGFIVQGNGQEESDDYYYNGSTTPNTRWRGDNLGISVSGAGDMNNDGFSDIVVGAPNASLNGIVGAGAVYVILGKKEGFSTVDLAGFVSSDSTGFIVQGAVEYFNLGTSVSGAGDVNNDGFSDIVLGAHHASFYGKGTTGAVYVLFGRAGGFSTVDLADFVSSDSTGYMIQGAEAGDNLGISVSGAGDMNNDGFSDVVVGASQASPNLRLRAGAVYVILGKKEGFSTVDLVGFVSSDSTGFIVQGAVEYFNLGTSVSGAGDVNGDGCDDVIIGAPRASPSFKWGVKRSAGVAFVILGKKKGFATVDVARLSSSDSTGYMIQGAEGRDDSEGDNLGTSVSGAGDANGDGLADGPSTGRPSPSRAPIATAS